jgi:hypothetical protein
LTVRVAGSEKASIIRQKMMAGVKKAKVLFMVVSF